MSTGHAFLLSLALFALYCAVWWVCSWIDAPTVPDDYERRDQ